MGSLLIRKKVGGIPGYKCTSQLAEVPETSAKGGISYRLMSWRQLMVNRIGDRNRAHQKTYFSDKINRVQLQETLLLRKLAGVGAFIIFPESVGLSSTKTKYPRRSTGLSS